MNPFDILGSLMQGGMGPSAGRLQNTFGNQGFGGPGGMPGGRPGGMFGGGPGGMPPGGPGGMGGGLFDMLSKIAGSAAGGGGAPGGAGGGFFPFEILKRIGGNIFGGSAGTGAGPAAAGAGVLSVLGALAAQAIEAVKQMSGGAAGQSGPATMPVNLDDATAVIAGLRKPANPQEQEQVQDVATLTIRAMINAAKADGRIDEKEAQRLVGKMEEDGIAEGERRFVLEEMRKPMETDAIVRAVPNQQVAAQIYAASLMAIEVDTDAERRYMEDLANKLGMNREVVAYLHQAVGIA